MSSVDIRNLKNSIFVRYRAIFVCIFLLPIAFLYNLWFYTRNQLIFSLNSAPKKHHSKVKHVQRQVQEWIKSGRTTQMCTARPGWQTMCFRRPRYKNTLYNIEVNLVDVLEVDADRRVVKVEPLVTMGQLSAILNQLGWTIPVLPELDELTVGGLVMGTGIESASHKHGLFQHICLSYELVLSDGSLVTCSKDENPDLFYAVPWSYGTLGLLTSVDIKIIPSKRYVRLEYHPVRGLKEFAMELERLCGGPDEFVEGFLFDETRGVITTGNLSDNAETGKVNAIGKWYKPWFFRHVENTLQGADATEYIPLRDYYHRHTRSIFWELQDIVSFGNNPFFRYLLGWLMPPKVSLLKLTQTETIKRLYEELHVLQDVLVPLKRFKETIRLLQETVEVYPLWICPFVLPDNPGFVHPVSTGAEMYVDIGVYGVPKTKDYNARKTTRAIEKFVMDVNGFQMLYADTYTTVDEFRKMFDHTLYDKVRGELGCCDAFPEVHEKVCKAARI